MSASDVPARIKELREQHLGYTQVELAAHLKSRRGRQIDPVNISRWERGAAEPSLWYLRQLADLADLPLQWFFGDKVAA